jgi:hypothetical protein
LQRIAFAYLDEIGKSTGSDIRARPCDLCRAELTCDELAPSIVMECGGKV